MQRSTVGRALASALALAVALGALAEGRASAQEGPVKTLVTRFNGVAGCRRAGISFGTISGTASGATSGTTSSTISTWDSVGQVQNAGEALRAIRDNDVFEIGSITKTFTATLYALALSEHKVTASDAAQQYMVPGFTLPRTVAAANGNAPAIGDATITLDNLARHASGLPRAVASQNGSLPLDLMYQEASRLQLRFTPGSQYLYSNLGFAILSLAMEKVYGLSVDVLPQIKVAEPLGMESTIMPPRSNDWRFVLLAYNPDGTQARRGNDSWPAFYGAGGFLSTPADMQLFLKYNMGLLADNPLNPLLPTLQSTVPLTNFEPPYQHVQIGLAWEKGALPGGHAYFFKDGSVPGFNSYIGFTAPGTTPQAGVVILANQGGGRGGCKAIRLGRCVLETLLRTRQDAYCANPNAAPVQAEGRD